MYVTRTPMVSIRRKLLAVYKDVNYEKLFFQWLCKRITWKPNSCTCQFPVVMQAVPQLQWSVLTQCFSPWCVYNFRWALIFPVSFFLKNMFALRYISTIKTEYLNTIRYSLAGEFCIRNSQRDLGPVHTYPDIFESATFSFRVQKFLRPHVAYSNRIRPSTRIRWYPDSL